MGVLNPGEVEITLDGKECTLKPSLRALNMISGQAGGLARVRELLVAQDFNTAVLVIRYGLNLADSQVKTLPDQVYRTGLGTDLLIPLINFVGILGNGGKPLPDSPVEPAPDAEGNG